MFSETGGGLVQILFNEINCNYAFSMPIGSHNLIAPDMGCKPKGGRAQTVDYFMHCQQKGIDPGIMNSFSNLKRIDAIQTLAPCIMTIGIMPLDEKNMYIKTKIKITAKDPNNSNVKLPVTELKFNIRGREKTEKQAFVFTKIDPSKGWGSAGHPRDLFNIEVKAKPGASGTKIDENTEVDYGD